MNYDETPKTVGTGSAITEPIAVLKTDDSVLCAFLTNQSLMDHALVHTEHNFEPAPDWEFFDAKGQRLALVGESHAEGVTGTGTSIGATELEARTRRAWETMSHVVFPGGYLDWHPGLFEALFPGDNFATRFTGIAELLDPRSGEHHSAGWWHNLTAH